MTAAAEQGDFGRSAGTLSAGVGAAGLLTYLFFSLASHNLDAIAYGEIVVLWSAVFVTISVLHRPVEQYISRSIAAHEGSEHSPRPALRSAAILQGGVALAFATVALALREPLEEGLFSGDETLYWIYLASVLCFAASFFARGYLAGHGRFPLLAALLVSESAARTAFALAVAVGIASGKDAVALGVVAAPIFSLLVVPLAFGRRTARAAGASTLRGESGAENGAVAAEGSIAGERLAGVAERRARDHPRRLAEGGAFAGAVFLIMLAEQAFLNGGPLLIYGLEGAAAAGFIFNVLMLARAPLLVFQGVAVSLLPHLTRLRARGDPDAQSAFGDSIGQTLRAVAAFTVLVAAIVAIAGPTLMQAAFGDRFSYDRTGLLLVTVAMGLYLAATTLNQAALAQGRARRAAGAWVACALGFLAWSAIPLIDDAARRIEIGFLLGAAVLCALLRRVYREARIGDADAPPPGSAEEIEARLALADEAS